MIKDNTTPMHDGEMVRFHPPPSARRSCSPRPDVHVLYINGMSTDGAAHRRTAQAIANVIETPVVGIYNATAGFMSDSMQVKRDYRLNLARGNKNFIGDVVSPKDAATAYLFAPKVAGIAYGLISGMQTWDRYQNQLPQEGVSPAARHLAALGALSHNVAACVLYGYIFTQFVATGRAAKIVCHSQGNLIVSNALDLLWEVTGFPLTNVTVYALASPAVHWPCSSGMRMRGPYNIEEDLVPRMGSTDASCALPRTASIGGRSGVSEQHATETYLAKTPFIQDLRQDLGLFRLAGH